MAAQREVVGVFLLVCVCACLRGHRLQPHRFLLNVSLSRTAVVVAC